MKPWKELGMFLNATSKDPNERNIGALMFLNEEDDEIEDNDLNEEIDEESDESEDEEDQDE